MTSHNGNESSDTKDERLTLALAHYDRHVPLFEGVVTIPGIALDVLEVGQSAPGRHGSKRHERMLNKREFDIAEVSMSSYLLAKDQGAPFTAIPVFPRRLFSMSQMWVRADSGINSPEDLRGKRVGLSTFQTTLSVLAKADLTRAYNVPWRDIIWVTQRDETIPFTPSPDVKLERLQPGQSLVDAIMEGKLDSIMIPHPSHDFLRNRELVRLLRDPIGAEQEYFRNFGYFPIMHVIAFREEVLRRSPDLARAVFEAFERSFQVAKDRWDDPNWSLLAWGRQRFEEQKIALADEIWPNGIRKNRDNLKWFIDQSHDQGLISNPMRVEDLFHPSTIDL